ncbi:MAG: hypothetical protein KJN98_00585, partial [Pontiella sp.]|nr:hypothetical protein [Pontiella sp.]
MKCALIISDGKPGHVNQSKALCAHLGIEYETQEVVYKNKASKGLSYLLDRLGIYSEMLYSASSFKFHDSGFSLLISTGSA